MMTKRASFEFFPGRLILVLFLWLFVGRLFRIPLQEAVESNHQEIITETNPSPNGALVGGGLTYRLYENAARRNASFQGITPTARIALKAPDNNSSLLLLSGELTGSLSLQNSKKHRWIVVRCIFRKTSNGWVKIDGHLVCHDGNAFAGELDHDPLLIQANRSYSIRGWIMSNETTTTPTKASMIPSLEIYWVEYDRFRPTNHDDSFKLLESLDDSYQKQQQQLLLDLQPSLSHSEDQRELLQKQLANGWGYWLRKDLLSLVKLPEGIVFRHVLCLWDPFEKSKECLPFVGPDSNGDDDDDDALVRVETHAYDRSYVSFRLIWKPSPNPRTNATTTLAFMIELSVSGDQHQELRYHLTFINRGHEHDDDRILLVDQVPSYAWFLPGRSRETRDGFRFETPGLDPIDVVCGMDFSEKPLHPRPTAFDGSNRILQSGNSIVLTSGLDHGETPRTTMEIIRFMKHQEEERITQRFGPSLAKTAIAIQAAVMWSLIYNPMEEGPFLPVSRSEAWSSFGERAGAVSPDWTYVLFEWDNIFASLLAGLESKEIAYSNLFQVLKSKTTRGFVPNWSTAGGIGQSKDRTEPPVGAKVLLELYNKFGDLWLVEGLFDDLVDWNDWFWNERLLEPLGLIGLGSYCKTSQSHSAGDINNLQAARYESGLDNSPMYDGETLYNNETHMMKMYDVGMSSLVANEAYCLAQLADILGKTPEVGNALRRRGDLLRSRILRYLWDPNRRIFANRYTDAADTIHRTAFVPHVTPTSFYPLLLLPSNASEWSGPVSGMIKDWLLNPNRFCLSRDGNFGKNDPHRCYWGLPSVSADDPTYMAPGHWNYWRGLVWGPMSQIVFWSLDRWKDVDVVVTAKTSLCKQMNAMMMYQWKANRHICENYSPYRDAPDCSGTLFYHWGALNGLIAILEADLYNQ